MAFGFTWVYELLFLVLLHLPLIPWVIPAPIVGPTVSAFIMTALTEGDAGIGRLLRRYVLWRVGVQWYLLVLIGLPALILLSFLAIPGAITAFRAPAPTFVLTYLSGYIIIFFTGGPLFEEPGWGSFALPRLQQRSGPLLGTLIRGVLWGLWPLPLFLIPGYNGAGTGFVGISIPFVEFVIGTMAMAVIFTWVFNTARGSLLLMMLLHASINTAVGTFGAFFPSLHATPLVFLMLYVFLVVAALLIIVATRGCLSYQRYQREVVSLAPDAVVEQEPGTAGTSA